jgi:alkanesulfonate monooxygenase SsuD/methylene tetrahydromethanopterin reductase-like flavin-dependent oxidoreductase (luciferase family)
MDVALYMKDFVDDPNRSMHQQIEQAADAASRAEAWGFMGIYAPQHWLGYPSAWVEPIPLLSRLAPETGNLKLITGVIVLPLHNPVHLAEQVTAIDQISNGRFVLGLGVGYRQAELEAAGTDRSERASRFDEALGLMKQLWSGEQVDFDGKYWHVHARMAVTPVQTPHPPVWIASQSRRATRRAAATADAVILGPQPSWKDVDHLAGIYKDALAEKGKTGLLGAHRIMAIAKDRETAIRQAREMAESKAKMYGGYDMQEGSTVDLGLSGERDLSDWAIVGSPQDCAETISRSYHETGLRYIGLGALNMPKDHSARLEHVQYISEELLPLLP